MRRSLSPVLAAAALLAPSVLAAQSQWLPPTDDLSVAFEYVHPHLDGAARLDFGPESPVQGAMFLSGVMPVTHRVRAMAELPLGVSVGGNGACAGGTCSRFRSGAFVGNPYLGAELALGPAIRWTAGIRLPLQSIPMGDSLRTYGGVAVVPALAAAQYDRPEAFFRRASSAETGVEARLQFLHGNEVRLHAAGVLVHDAQIDRPYGRVNVVQWRLGTQVWHTQAWAGRARVVGGLGVSVLNVPGYPSGRATEVEWGIAAGPCLGRWLPLIELRVPTARLNAVPGAWIWRVDRGYTLELAVQYQ